jgi:molybdopterin-guanine dinucleotide biosynthesis protein A
MAYTVYSMTSAAGVVLAGGRSSRMGTAKAALEWHGTTLLDHVVGVVSRAVDGPVVVVRAPGQTLPELPASVRVCEDPEEGLGPLQGISVGLADLADEAQTAFVCSTDLPFLHAEFVRTVLRGFRPGAEQGPPAVVPDVVLPIVGGYRQPLAAGYRTHLFPQIDKLLEAGRLRPAHLFEECDVRQLGSDELLANARLAAVDPELDSVVNVNAPEDYRAARSRPAPEVVVELYGVLATRSAGRGPHRLRAANVACAAEQAGLQLDGHVLAAINGDQIHGGGHLPLLAGDTVSFISADAGG